MWRKLCALCLFLTIMGCIVAIEDLVRNFKPGMNKKDIDLALHDKGKWIGPVETEKGTHAVWGYPSTGYGQDTIFDQEEFKRYYLFFDGNKYVKFTDNFSPYLPKTKNATPAGVAGPSSFTGGRVPGSGAGDMELEGVESPPPSDTSP